MRKTILAFIVAVVLCFSGQVLGGEPRFYGQSIFNVALTFNADISVTDQINLLDGTDTHIIKAVRESGLGGRLTIGLDETARTVVICDAGDIDVDFGLPPSDDPALVIMHPTTVTSRMILSYYRFGLYRAEGYCEFNMPATGPILAHNLKFTVNAENDLAAGDFNTFNSDANIELTDTDGEQSWVYIEPKINQSDTGAYNGLKIDVTETHLGTGATGDGNNLLNLQVASATKFAVSNGGMITTTPETVTCTTEAGTASINIRTSLLVTDGDADTDEDTVALDNGVVGDEKVFVYLTETDAGDSINVTPTTGLGFTKILFDVPGEGCIMVYTASGWAIVSNNGGTIT